MRATLKLKYLRTFPSLHFVNFKQGLMKAKLCLYKYDKQAFMELYINRGSSPKAALAVLLLHSATKNEKWTSYY